MDVAIEKIFDRTRLPRNWHLIPLYFYFPLGLTIAIIRFFIGIHTFLVSGILLKLPSVRCFVLRIMCSIMGFIIIEENRINTKENAKVIVANHVTNFDHLAVNLVKQCIVPSVWDLPRILNWMLGYTDLSVTKGRNVFINNVKQCIQEQPRPVLAFPEGATTNGKVALLKFSLWPFSLEQPVNPVVIRVKQPPLIKVSLSVLGSRWWSDMFWFLFVPYTIFCISFLPQMQKNVGETTEDFCIRIQNAMCNKLGLEAANLTSFKKVEYAKQVLGKTD